MRQLCHDAGRSFPFIVMNKWDKALEEKESARKKASAHFKGRLYMRAVMKGTTL